MTHLVQAHAKLNLTLEVLGRRADGFHELRSLMCTLALHDTVHLDPAPTTEVCCTLPDLVGPANLAFRAAELLRAAAGHAGGARITIEKVIPVAAGLGGGSADAAAVLVGLNGLWESGLDTDALRDLAAQLGSDVPFCVLAGTALAAGRGEILRPIPPLPEATVLVVRPPFAVSTAQVYGALTADGYGTGEGTRRLAVDAYRISPADWRPVNSLEPVTCRLYPVVREILEFLRSHGAPHAAMCGSGPSCFALFASPEPAERAVAAARAQGWDAWVTRIMAGGNSALTTDVWNTVDEADHSDRGPED